MKKALLPAGWVKPRGYANGVAATGTQVFIAGQIGWDEQARFQTTDFAAQAIQALKNVLAVLHEAGGKPEHLVRLTWYVTDKREYLAVVERHRPRVSRADRRLRHRDERGAGRRADRRRSESRNRGDRRGSAVTQHAKNPRNH